MRIDSWPGLIAVILAIISFYGTTYLVIALNVGWRFGYWLASACFGILMVLLSLFWALNVRTDQAVGPQGALPKWIPVSAGEEIRAAEFKGEPIRSLSSYPGGGWEEADEGNPDIDSFGSALTGCVSVELEDLSAGPEKETCEKVQQLMPADKEVPVLEGAAVAVVPQVKELRFVEDDQGRIGQAVIRPVTTDPRVSKDPDGKLLAPEFRFAAILDKGSVGLPSYMSLLIFLIYTAFHLWGLHRAEQRQLSPAVT